MHHNPGAVRKIPQGQKNKTPEPKKKTKTKNKFGVVFVLRRSARKCRGNLGFDESIEAWASWRSAGPKQRKPTNKKNTIRWCWWWCFCFLGCGFWIFSGWDPGLLWDILAQQPVEDPPGPVLVQAEVHQLEQGRRPRRGSGSDVRRGDAEPIAAVPARWPPPRRACGG